MTSRHREQMNQGYLGRDCFLRQLFEWTVIVMVIVFIRCPVVFCVSLNGLGIERFCSRYRQDNYRGSLLVLLNCFDVTWDFQWRRPEEVDDILWPRTDKCNKFVLVMEVCPKTKDCFVEGLEDREMKVSAFWFLSQK